MSLVGVIIAPGVSRIGEIRLKPERLQEAYKLGLSLA